MHTYIISISKLHDRISYLRDVYLVTTISNLLTMISHFELHVLDLFRHYKIASWNYEINHEITSRIYKIWIRIYEVCFSYMWLRRVS